MTATTETRPPIAELIRPGDRCWFIADDGDGREREVVKVDAIAVILRDDDGTEHTAPLDRVYVRTDTAGDTDTDADGDDDGPSPGDPFDVQAYRRAFVHIAEARAIFAGIPAEARYWRHDEIAEWIYDCWPALSEALDNGMNRLEEAGDVAGMRAVAAVRQGGVATVEPVAIGVGPGAEALAVLLDIAGKANALGHEAADRINKALPPRMNAASVVMERLGCGKFEGDADDCCGIASAMWYAHKRALEMLSVVQDMSNHYADEFTKPVDLNG